MTGKLSQSAPFDLSALFAELDINDLAVWKKAEKDVALSSADAFQGFMSDLSKLRFEHRGGVMLRHF